MTLPKEALDSYRAHTFRLLPGMRLKDRDDAVQFVNDRGFVCFWPITGVVLPSLWSAVAGDRPVADAHDDPGHVTWGWKDALLGQRAWYYAKVLRKKATMIAFSALPYFYALSENFGVPEEDYLTLYHQGRLTAEAKAVFEALLDHGPLDTIALRKAARLSSPENEGRFNKAIADLQADFKVLPVGVTQAGAWHYAFAYDVTHRQYPELIEQTRFITEEQAREVLAALYLRSVGAAQERDFSRLFGWPGIQVMRIIPRLVTNHKAEWVNFEGQKAEYLALPEFLAGGISPK